MKNYEIYLPKFESFKKTLIRKHGSLWNLPKFDYPHGRFDVYWKICHRVIESNIGKSFDMAFHYYCKKSPRQFHYLFLKEFEKEEFHWRYRKYDVDENKNIILKPAKKYKREAIVFTHDYQTRVFHKITGKPYSYYEKMKRLSFHLGVKKIQEANENRLWEDRVVSGKKLVFSGFKDPVYKRLTTDLLKKQKAALRKKKKKFTEEEVRAILKEHGKKEKEENRIKIEAHGFSPELSFRKHDIR